MNDAGSLTVLKQADGTYRWVLISSNSFEDRDREIVSQKALEADVAWADATKEYGPLRWWHVPGLDIGDCDFNMTYGRMLVESGTFRHWRYAEAVKERAGELGASIGFSYPHDEPDAEGVFHNIRRYERSLLPRQFASNPFTSVQVKETSMPTQAEKIKAFAEFMQVDEATGQKMLLAAETAEKEAIAANVRSKAKDDDKPEAEDKPNGESAAADAPVPQAVAEDDAKPEDETVKKKEFDPVMAALVGKIDQLAADLHILTTANAEKAKRDADTLAAVKQVADEALAATKELKGELPRKLGDPLSAFRPSQSGAEPREALKEAAPRPGPMDKHYAAIFPTAATPTPPGM